MKALWFILVAVAAPAFVLTGIRASEAPVAIDGTPERASAGGSVVHYDLDAVFSPSVEDTDRGCCVWKTEPPQCVFTNRGYCRRKADEAAVPFDFYADTECKAVSACPSR